MIPFGFYWIQIGYQPKSVCEPGEPDRRRSADKSPPALHDGPDRSAPDLPRRLP